MSSDPRRRQPGVSDSFIKVLKDHEQRIKKVENLRANTVVIGSYTLYQDSDGRLVAKNRATGEEKIIF